MVTLSERMAFFRKYKGKRIDVMLLLMCYGGAMKKRDIAAELEWSPATVGPVVDFLVRDGLLQDNGRLNGFSLKTKPIPSAVWRSLLGKGYEEMIAAYSESNQEGFSSSSINVYQDEMFAGKHEGTTTTKGGPTYSESKQEEPPLTAEQEAIKAWLIRGGIGSKSTKLKSLLWADLDLEFVRGHVLDRLAAVNGRDNDPPPGGYRTGLLIRRLEQGIPHGPERCETHYYVLPCLFCSGVIQS